jgi:hypothetical protein
MPIHGPDSTLNPFCEDMSLSKDLTQQFKERQETAPDPDDISFSVMVLGTNFWPLTPPNYQFNIPEDLNKTYNRFQMYYQSKHSCVCFHYHRFRVVALLRPRNAGLTSDSYVMSDLIGGAS